MKKLFLLLTVVSLIFGSGCGLIPKRVEFGQDKVERVPEKTAKRLEAERQAAKLAGEKAREAEKIATEDGSAAAKPAGEAASLAESVSLSLGPPKNPWPNDSESAILVARLERMLALHNEALRKFTEDNNKNAGKKIEGTGWLSVPYFVWAGGAVILIFVLLTLAKIALSVLATMNPGVGLGLKVAQIGGRGLSNAFSEVLKGGEAFKNRLKQRNDITPAVRDELLELFKQSHQIEHSPETQRVIQHLTRP